MSKTDENLIKLREALKEALEKRNSENSYESGSDGYESDWSEGEEDREATPSELEISTLNSLEALEKLQDNSITIQQYGHEGTNYIQIILPQKLTPSNYPENLDRIVIQLNEKSQSFNRIDFVDAENNYIEESEVNLSDFHSHIEQITSEKKQRIKAQNDLNNTIAIFANLEDTNIFTSANKDGMDIFNIDLETLRENNSNPLENKETLKPYQNSNFLTIKLVRQTDSFLIQGDNLAPISSDNLSHDEFLNVVNDLGSLAIDSQKTIEETLKKIEESEFDRDSALPPLPDGAEKTKNFKRKGGIRRKNTVKKSAEPIYEIPVPVPKGYESEEESYPQEQNTVTNPIITEEPYQVLAETLYTQVVKDAKDSGISISGDNDPLPKKPKPKVGRKLPQPPSSARVQKAEQLQTDDRGLTQ